MFFLKIIDDQDQELELMQKDYKSPIPEKYQWRTWAADPEPKANNSLMPACGRRWLDARKLAYTPEAQNNPDQLLP